MDYVELQTGGKLIRYKWNGDKGEFDQTDATEFAPRFLWDECRVTDATTLNDVFLLLNENIDIFDVVIGNWCREFVDEALNNEPEEESDLASCDLQWNFTTQRYYADENQTELEGINHPNFGGTGKDGVSYGISFTPVYKMKNVPLRLIHSATLFDEGEFYKNKDYKNPDKYTQTFDRVSFTLGDILYGIIWELSWYGNPSERDKQGQELNDMVDNIKEEDCIPFEEVMSQLRADIEDRE